MRFTIERLRLLVLAAGVLLVVALAAFLAVGKWRNILSGRDLPKKLGKNIVQEASGVTYTEAHGGHVLFRIHASRAEQLQDQHALLHDVQIEFFSKDGRGIDKIAGSDFEYDQASGIGAARGPVQITLTRLPMKQSNSAKPPAAAGTVHVETSGLTFDQNSGVLTTAEKVNFTMADGSGSAVGAKYDSQQGYLVLDRAVELTTVRARRKVVLHAAHAEFDRDAQLCLLTGAQTEFKGGQSEAGRAKILFRADGSAQKLDATDGFTLATAGGGNVTAPTGTLVFGAHNEPQSGDLQGGTTLKFMSASRQLQGSAPDAHLDFLPTGTLHLLTLNQGAEIHSETQSGAAEHALNVSRTWASPMAQVIFRPAANGGIEPAELRGSGGVVVTSLARRGNTAPAPARLAADQVTGEFGPGAQLTAITGTGHAAMEQTLADGARQTASGDRIEAQFSPSSDTASKPAGAQGSTAQIHSAVLKGHVALLQQPARKPGAQAQSPLRAAAGRATYEDLGQRLQLTENPSVDDDGLHLTASTIDVSQQTGQAFARGGVKATWLGAGAPGSRGGPSAEPAGLALGGQAPAHVIADEAQLSQAGGDAVFRGHARLWQDANSISAPTIVLNRDKQTMVARSRAPSEPVEAVLLGTGQAATQVASANAPDHGDERAGAGAPAVIRVRGGEFVFIDSTHQAVMKSGTMGQVVAQAGGATCSAREVILLLKPRDGRAQTAEVERVTASGGVVVASEGRRGTGARLVYSSQTGEYALTGTAAAPPRLTDPTRGTVTGAALIFNSRNDSVSIEGRGRETRTETTAPR